MPDQLFYPTNTVTAIGVFTAHVPHSKTKKTWFYSLKDDGFEISNKKRLDINNLWDAKKNNLLESFGNRETVEGKSTYVHVKADDEWIAEAYIEADYSQLTIGGFVKSLVNYYANMYITSNGFIQIPKVKKNANEKTNTSNWKWFKLTDIFNLVKGISVTKKTAEEQKGNTSYVSASAENNGVTAMTSIEATHKAPCISVSANGSVMECFFQNKNCIINNDVNILYLKKEKLTENIALFLITLLKQLKFKYNYGRKPNLTRLKNESIKLPINKNGNPDWNWIESFMENLKK